MTCLTQMRELSRMTNSISLTIIFHYIYLGVREQTSTQANLPTWYILLPCNPVSHLSKMLSLSERPGLQDKCVHTIYFSETNFYLSEVLNFESFLLWNVKSLQNSGTNYLCRHNLNYSESSKINKKFQGRGLKLKSYGNLKRTIYIIWLNVGINPW